VSPPTPISVLIVDDSPIVRRRLKLELERHGDITVVATAENPFVARDCIKAHSPQVIILDMEMPRMDGLTFLRKIMQHRPTPTIIVSSLTPKGCELAVACLQAGAFGVLPKPHAGFSVEQLSTALVTHIRAAAHAQVRSQQPDPGEGTPLTHDGELQECTPKLVAIGASTGGTEALRQVLQLLPVNVPGIVIVQHMPALFTSSFAERLNSLCAIEVREAQDGDAVHPGLALVAPGDHHMMLSGSVGHYKVSIVRGPKVCRHRPSVEVLFETTARVAREHALGIIMTGMGDDGATALGSMRSRGAHTLAQDQATCVVYGMPGTAVERDSVSEIVPLGELASRIVAHGADGLRRAAG